MNINLEKIINIKTEIPTFAKYEQELFKLDKSFEAAWVRYLEEDKGLELYYLKDDQEVIGLLGYTFEIGKKDSVIFEEGKVSRFLMAIVVKDKYKGTSASKLLMDKFLEVTEDNKTDSASLRVAPKNERAIAFYKKFGFEEYYKNDASIYMKRNY